MVLGIVLIAAAAYLLGSIPTGYLLVRLFRNEDIRAVGSGNIGATNVMRSGSKGLGIATFFLDMLKGCAAVWIGGLIGSALIPEAPHRSVQALAALCAVLGHMFPIWLKFRGGKGVATALGSFALLAPTSLQVTVGIFVAMVLLFRRVSLGSIVAVALFPLLAWRLHDYANSPRVLGIMAIASLLIIGRHHQNIHRLLIGTEPRFQWRRG